LNDLPRIALARDAARPEIYLVVNGVKLHIASPSEMTALGFDWGKVRIVPQSVIDGIPT
jgi:hypothetical protein